MTNNAGTKEAAKKLAGILRNKKRAVILLHGDMGVGKTTFVSEVMRHLVPGVRTSSPTFALINQYAPNIFHADLYRIKDESELYNIGFFEILEGENIVFVEWGGILTNNEKRMTNDDCTLINVYFEVVNESERKVTFD